MSIFGNTGGGLFGAQNNNQATSGNPLFGSAATANPAPLQAQPTQPSLFGNTNTTNTGTTGGGLFGGTTNNANQAGAATGGGLFGATTMNQPANTGSGLFGNTQAAPASGTSLFGNTTTGNTSTNPLFGGAKPAGTSLFGNTTAGTTNTGATGGGGLFGNTTTTPATGGGLFGNTNNNAGGAGGGLFGNTANNAGGTTGGLFGNTNTNTSTNTTGGGLFGSNTQQPAAAAAGTTGGGLFGNSTGGGLFSGTKPAAATSTSLFGSTTGNPLFGAGQQQQQPQQQQTSTLFGSATGNPLFGGGNKSTLGAPAQQNAGLTTSALGAPSNLLASRSNVGSQQQPADAQAQFQKLVQSIEGIYNAWNTQSKDCRFQYHFYNLVDPKQVNLYGRPPNATNDALWEKAVRENPDSSCLVPVIAIGFDDLRARVDAQTAQSTSHIQKLNDLQSRLNALRTQHSVSNTSRLLRATALQTQLMQRLMQLVQHLHLLIPAVRSSSLRPEEEALRGKLEEMEEEMRRGRVKGRLNELWALIGAIAAGADRAGGTPNAEGEWAVVDEEGLTQISQILSEQQAGLQHLTKILQKDQKDLAVIMGTKGSGSEEDAYLHDGGGDALWASTTTLRASSLRL